MITVNVRKQGGAAIITIPANVLKILNIDIGSSLELDVKDGEFTVRPISRARKRYSLSELLHGVTPEALDEINAKTEWAREGKPSGRELA